MEHKRLIVDIALVAGLLALTGVAWAQHRSLTHLEETLAQVDARMGARESGRPSMAVDSQPAGEMVAGHAAVDGAVVVPAVPRLVPGSVPPTQGVDAPATVDVADPVVRDQLREMIVQEQEFVTEERWQQRSQRRAERLRLQVTALAEKTGMDEAASERLADLLLVEQAEAADIFRQSREDFSWDEAREKVTQLRTETDDTAKGLLEEDEYVEYQKMREEERSRWGGQGRGRGGPPAPTRGTEVAR